MAADIHLRNPLLFGSHEEAGIVAVEHVATHDADTMKLFIREGDRTVERAEPFRPFLWIERAELLTGCPAQADVTPLQGRAELRAVARFAHWHDFGKAVAWLKKAHGYNPSDPSAPYFLINDPEQQFLMSTGRTLFKGMTFSQLRRMQVDIETYCTSEFEFSNSERESDRIIAMALADNTGWTEVLSGAELDEKALLVRFVELVRERDPDVIEGHNILKFDLPYLQARAARHKVALKLGRDGGKLKTRPGRFSVAEQTVTYTKAEIHGRHVVDTYFLAQAYDVTHRSLESLSLKDIAVHFGVAPANRTYLEGDDIAPTFDRDPATVMRYALDDIRETRAIADILSPSYFAQAQMLPFTYQNVFVRGTGSKIDSLLLREYLRQETAIPRPNPPRDFAGGYTDIFFTGVARNVHHCDARSLYPSLMLKDKLGPSSDERGIFLTLLRDLRDFRVDAKRRMQETADADERNHLDALQTTFKILINSFYGYLGFSQGRFNDFNAAEAIAAGGRELLRLMINWLKSNGARPIEIDTDGIYFVPSDLSPAQLLAFRRDFQAALPEGIEVEFDGEYVAMFSYKMKNYALLDAQGEITIKGAALKSRGLEPFQRDFMREWLRLTLEGRDGERAGLAARYRDAIANRQWPIRVLAKTETLQDSPASYASKIGEKARGRNAAYELALRSGRDYRAGDQISYYVTGTKKSVAVHEAARPVSEWKPDQRDENVAYYLAKLDALMDKFDGIAKGDSQGEFALDS
jgi:DNA polymerase elongation subunit (family B)